MVASGSSRFGDRQPNNPFDVAWGGRVYPDRPSGLVGGRDKVHNLRTDPSNPLLADRLAESLWQRLPFAAYSDALPEEPDALMQSYLASLAQIHRMQSDVLKLVHRLCQTNSPGRQYASQARTRKLRMRPGSNAKRLPRSPPIKDFRRQPSSSGPVARSDSACKRAATAREWFRCRTARHSPPLAPVQRLYVSVSPSRSEAHVASDAGDHSVARPARQRTQWSIKYVRTRNDYPQRQRPKYAQAATRPAIRNAGSTASLRKAHAAEG